MTTPAKLEPEHAALAADFAPYLCAVNAQLTFTAPVHSSSRPEIALALPTGDHVHLGASVPEATRILAALADKHAQREADRKPMGRPPTARATEGVHPIFCELALDLHETFTALRTSRSLTLRAAVEEALRLWVSTQSHPP